MAIVQLSQPLRVGYDTTTKELLLEFTRELAEPDADWVPDKAYVVRLPIAGAVARDLVEGSG